MGALALEPCACGRTFLRLVALEGRVEDLVPLALVAAQFK
jgi:phenylacetate-coenzyme A ligase PaaK-like adenylate-forming protein